MWTNGRVDVWRSEAQTVFRAWAGRRSINSRGAGVERSEVREWRVTQVRRLTAIDRDLGASVPRARSVLRNTEHSPRSGPPSDAPANWPAAPARRIAVGAVCWCRWWRSGPERALGAALASGLDGAGDLATRVDGCPVGVAVVKSPRLALERLQCNHSATLFARRARGKSGRLEVWRAPGEKGAVSRRAQRWVRLRVSGYNWGGRTGDKSHHLSSPYSKTLFVAAFSSGVALFHWSIDS